MIKAEVDVVRRGKWDEGKFYELEIDALQWDIEDLETIAETYADDTQSQVLNRIKDAAIAALATQGRSVSRNEIRVDGLAGEEIESTTNVEPVVAYKGRGLKVDRIPKRVAPSNPVRPDQKTGRVLLTETVEIIKFPNQNQGYSDLTVVINWLKDPNTNRVNYYVIGADKDTDLRQNSENSISFPNTNNVTSALIPAPTGNKSTLVIPLTTQGWFYSETRTLALVMLKIHSDATMSHVGKLGRVVYRVD